MGEDEGIIGKVGVCMMAMKSNMKQPVSKYAEDWLPVKQIMNGMIQLDSGEYVTGIKVNPKNIFILDPENQNATIFNLRNFYNMIDYEFWLVVADRPVDINVYLAQLQLLYNDNPDPITRKLVNQDINKANMFMSNEYNVSDTEYFILFKEKKMEIIQKRIHNLISGLANCNLTSQQVSNADLRMIMDNFLNGGLKTDFGTVTAV